MNPDTRETPALGGASGSDDAQDDEFRILEENEANE